MDADPLIPAPIYGLRTWSPVLVEGRERLAGTYEDVIWPPAGAWLEAECRRAGDHAAPAPGCDCGAHGWHPRRATARRVLSTRGVLPGVIEAEGVVELHTEGFRAERARPHALFAAPGRNRSRIARVASEYGIEIVDVGAATDVLTWCQARGLGLDAGVVARLLDPARERSAPSPPARWRRDALRVVAAVAVAAALVVAGEQLAFDAPEKRTLHGRTGEVVVGD